MSDASKHSKHMTLDDRIEIQECLDHGMTFKAIVHRISMDPTTISKEVKKCFRLKPISVSSFVTDTSKEINAVCPQLLKAPFVCNGCKKRSVCCGSQKRLYQAKSAQIEYESILSEAHEGIPLRFRYCFISPTPRDLKLASRYWVRWQLRPLELSP